MRAAGAVKPRVALWNAEEPEFVQREFLGQPIRLRDDTGSQNDQVKPLRLFLPAEHIFRRHQQIVQSRVPLPLSRPSPSRTLTFSSAATVA